MALTERAGRILRNLSFAVAGGIVLPALYVLLVPYIARLAGWLVPSVQLEGVLIFPLAWPAILYDGIFPPAPLPPNLMSGGDFPRVEAIILMIVFNFLQFAILTYVLLELCERRRGHAEK